MSVLEHGPIPDGWEIVPDGQSTRTGAKFWHYMFDEWCPSVESEVVVGTNSLTYIRPIRREAEPKTTFETDVKGEPVATARQWIALPEGTTWKTGQKITVTVEVN